MATESISSLGITWAHGTTGASFMILPFTDFSLQPTGALLQKRIAPLCGELMCGGLRARGISYFSISGTGPGSFLKALDYARNDGYIASRELVAPLSEIVKIVQESDPSIAITCESISALAINILRTRQLSESQYQHDDAEKVYAIAPRIEESIAIRKSIVDLMHSIVSIETPCEIDSSGESLVRIMENTFGNDILRKAYWSKARALAHYHYAAAHQPTFDTTRQIINCVSDTIDEISIAAFWNLLEVKHLQPKEFESQVVPVIEKTYTYSMKVFELIGSFFQRAVLPDQVPVHLSTEKAKQIKDFDRIPLIFASTHDLQSHVNQDLFTDKQKFSDMDHREIPILGPLKLGREINVLMTDPSHAPEAKKFLLDNRIQGVALYSFETQGSVLLFNPIPLT